MSGVRLEDAYAVGGAGPRGISTSYSIPLDGLPFSLGPFPFTPRGVSIINQTGGVLTVNDDRGASYLANPNTATTFGLGPTMRLTATIAPAQTSGKATVIVYDSPQAIASAQLANLSPLASGVKFLRNGIVVATENALNLLDNGANVWSLTDDAANSRVNVQGPRVITGRVNAAGGINSGSGFTVAKGAAGIYTITFTTAFASLPVVVGSAEIGNIVFSLQAAPTVNGFIANTFDAFGLVYSDRAFGFEAMTAS